MFSRRWRRLFSQITQIIFTDFADTYLRNQRADQLNLREKSGEPQIILPNERGNQLSSAKKDSYFSIKEMYARK